MVKLKPIEDQVVVLVGVTSGIGLETAHRFARRGARLVLAGRGQDDLNRTRDEVLRSGAADAITVEVDVANFEQVQSIAQAAVSHYGGFNTWAHIAGMSYYATIEDTPPDEFRRVIEINLNGPAWSALAALPHLKKNGGALIFVSSVNSRIEVPYQGAYTAAKHGMDGLINTLRIELKGESAPVALTNIIPGAIDTPFFSKAKTRIGVEPTAIPPVYRPDAVADAILYASEHPVRELNVGSSATIYQITKRVSPRLYDRMAVRTGFKGQKSARRKMPDARNHMYEHLEGFHRAEGKLDGRYSYSLWLSTHPVWRALLIGAVIAVPAMFVLTRRNTFRQKASRRFWTRVIEAIGISALISSRRPTLSQRAMHRVRQMMPTRFSLPVMRKQRMTEKLAQAVKESIPKQIFIKHEPSIPEKFTEFAKEKMPDNLFRRQPSIERVVRSAIEGYEKGVAAAKERV